MATAEEKSPIQGEQILALQNAKFAKTALSMGLLEQKDLEQAQQIQKNNKKPLRQILLENGLLTTGQADSVEESMKSTKMMYCSFCQKRYVMVGYSKTKSYKCQECKVDLELAAEEITQTSETSEQGKAASEVATSKKAPEEIVLSGAAKDLAICLPEEKQDELCGQRVHDYKILSRLGAGAMGVVYKAEQVKLQRVVAIKMLLAKFSQDEFYNKRFMAECRAAAKLNHHNILQIYDADSFKGRLFFAMEFVQGESILDILNRMDKIPVPNTLDIITQITQALCELYDHKLVHRDIKPGNIMLTTRGVAKLADLGLAKNMDYSKEMEARESGVLMGTPYYIAPEQISDALNVDCRADIFSLGAAFYRMVTAVVPFFHPDPRVVLLRVKTMNLPLASTLNKDITDAASWIIDKMMQKKAEDRFQTPAELLEVLHGLKDQMGSSPMNSAGVPELAAPLVVSPPAQTVNLDFTDNESQPVPPSPGTSAPSQAAEVFAALGKVVASAEIPGQPTAAPQDIKSQGKTLPVPKARREQSEAAGKPLRKTFVPAEDAPEKTVSTKKLVVGILVIVGIFALIFGLSGKKNKPLPITNKPAQPTEAEIAERIAHEYSTLSQQIDAALAQQKTEMWEDALSKAKSFRDKYATTSEGRRIKGHIRALEEKCLLAQGRQRYALLKSNIQTMLAQKRFTQAAEALNNEAEFPYTEIREEVKKFNLEIAEAAKRACQQTEEEARALQQNGQYHKAIELLRSQAGQLKEHLELLNKQMQNMEQQIKKHKILLEARETIYPLLVPKKFLDFKKSIDPNLVAKKTAEARQYLDKQQQEYPELATDIERLRAQVAVVENIDKALGDALKNDLRNKNFRFYFARDESKEEPFEGKVNTVSTRRSLTITSTKGVTKNWRIDWLTWSSKKEIVAAGAKNADIEYLFATLLVIEGDMSRIEKERNQWSEELQNKLMEDLSYTICLRIKKLTKEQKNAETGSLLAKFRSVSLKSQSGQALWDTLAETIYETACALSDKTKAARWYQLIVEHFPQSSYYQIAQQKLDQSKR
jgi:serine/threonine protein kinase